MKALYKYPQAAFPYAWLVEENRRRGREQPEFELEDTGIFDEQRYFDIFVEYAKAGPDDLADPHHARSIAARSAPRWRCCPRCGSAIPGRGGARAKATGRSPGSAARAIRRCWPSTLRSENTGWRRRAQASFSSPKTRRTWSGCSA
jgi:hypothetical protein